MFSSPRLAGRSSLDALATTWLPKFLRQSRGLPGPHLRGRSHLHGCVRSESSVDEPIKEIDARPRQVGGRYLAINEDRVGRQQNLIRQHHLAAGINKSESEIDSFQALDE